MAKGRPTDKSAVNTRQTRGPMRKNAIRDSAAALKEKADAGSAEAAPKKTARPRDAKGRDPVGSARSPFVSAVRKYGGLGAAERRAVEDVWRNGLSLKDAQAALMHNWLLLQKAWKDKKLELAQYISASNQLMASMTKLAELAEGKKEGLPSNINIVFNLGDALAGSEASPPPGPCGDKLEIE